MQKKNIGNEFRKFTLSSGMGPLGVSSTKVSKDEIAHFLAVVEVLPTQTIKQQLLY